MNIEWGFTLAVVVVGLVVVFAVLLLLVLLCTLMGRAFQSADKNKKSKDGEVTQPVVKLATPAKEQVAAPVAPAVESGIGDDVVAAISAALACMMGGESKFAVKSIKRARGSRPAWNSAGISENTRPF